MGRWARPGRDSKFSRVEVEGTDLGTTIVAAVHSGGREGGSVGGATNLLAKIIQTTENCEVEREFVCTGVPHGTIRTAAGIQRSTWDGGNPQGP